MAQLQESHPTTFEQTVSQVRVQLHEVVHAAREPIVTVILTVNDRRILGIGRGQSGQVESPDQLAGDATVHAINRLIGPRGQVRLEHIQRARSGTFDVCLVQLSISADGGTRPALGVSMISGDLAEAAARAVLDAVNRRLPRLIDLKS